MSGPLYVPVLPTRPHAAGACKRLWPDVRAAIRPLWNLPPLPGAAPETLATLVGKYVDPVSAVSRHGGWIDAPFGEEARIADLAEALSVYCELGRLRPVTGPERTDDQQTAAVETARRCLRGLGVRVRVTEEWDDGLGEYVRGLLARTGPEVPVDLLLDMGAVLGDRPDAGKEALRALDALMPLVVWRSAALLGGGFPRVTADMLEEGSREEPRAEWRMWHEVRATGSAHALLLGYGDYGVQPPSALSQAPAPGRKGGPSWGVLRYTTDSSYLLFKMLARGPDRIAVNRSAARRIVELPEFRGARAGQGEEWLSDCAHGPLSTSEGVGGPAEWLRAGNLQHMTYIVRSLPGG
ncbi:beta family protein [Streptomyces olivochromogenes]|uniref:beta family protein n=1 Tax=Streptomyces olivochromogenes TaxID=1963 RepID=UPI001F1D1B43|nr:beta family protein [Streptomyces olivochromogenes]MCF3131991.1 beta family protein [Streptomyces olivochromogenes]